MLNTRCSKNDLSIVHSRAFLYLKFYNQCGIKFIIFPFSCKIRLEIKDEGKEEAIKVLDSFSWNCSVLIIWACEGYIYIDHEAQGTSSFTCVVPIRFIVLWCVVSSSVYGQQLFKLFFYISYRPTQSKSKLLLRLFSFFLFL